MKNAKLFLTTAAVCAGLAVSFTAANAQSTDNTESSNQTVVEYAEPAIDLAKALEAAVANGKGDVDGIYLDYSELGPVYIAEMSSEMSETTLIISGETGEVIGTYSVEATSPEVFELMMFEMEDAMYGDDFEDEYFDFEDEEEELEELLMFLEHLGFTIEAPAD